MAEGPPWAMADMARPPPPARPAPPPVVARDMVDGWYWFADRAYLVNRSCAVIFALLRFLWFSLLYKWR